MIINKDIRLRLIKFEDTDFVLSLNNNLIIKKSFPRNYDITKQMHTRFLGDARKNGDYYFIISYKSMPVGTISIYDINKVHKRAEWGRFIIHPDFQRQGIGTLVLKKIIEYAFNDLDLHRLYCYIMSDNNSTIELYKKIGFEIEGTLKDHLYINGQFVNYHIMGVTKT